MSDEDKKAWQAEQEALDEQASAQRAKDEKARARKARKAIRRAERLKRELSKSGDLTDWEEEFTSSISERLSEYDSAFRDPEKGARGDALSYGQKAIMSQLSKKAKQAKRDGIQKNNSENDGSDLEPSKPAYKKRSSFKSKKPKFTPRIRQLDEDFCDEPPQLGPKEKIESQSERPPRPPIGKPFLRIVKNDD